LETRLVVFLLI